MARKLNHIGGPAERLRIITARRPPAWDDPSVETVPKGRQAQPQPKYVFDQDGQC